MPVLDGSGFHLTSTLVGGSAANGTMLFASDLGQVVAVQTDGTNTTPNGQMNVGDDFVVDTDGDGDFTDETPTTQTDNDRYVNSTVNYADGSSSTNVVLELVTLSDGSQVILVQDSGVNLINAASDSILSITLGTFNTGQDNLYNQNTYNNTITNTVVCFCEKTRVRTPTGERAIGTLTAGDEVVTAQDGAQKIVWIGKRTLSSAQLVASPHLKPVCIGAGALGDGVPRTDLLVSPQHRILIASKIAERMFGQREIFVPAIKLVGADNIEQVTSVAPVTYVHILFETHQVIFANGALAESLYTGPQALLALLDESRSEIYEIFPELQAAGQAAPTARPTVQKQALVNKLLARHQQNRKQLVVFENSDGSP